jgi:galactonate dehydratase
MTREGSHWLVPEAPGLGVEVDEAEAAKHPYEPEVPQSSAAVLPDGTVVDW